MLAGDMKLKTFLGLSGLGLGLGVLALVGWLVSRPPAPPPPAPPPPAPPPPAAAPLEVAGTSSTPAPAAEATRPGYEADVLAWVGKDLGSDKRKDVTEGRAWKVNVYQDAGQATANRAKVDLDRDDRWDQKWTFHDTGEVRRQVSPNDDETYTIEETWDGAAWRPTTAPP